MRAAVADRGRPAGFELGFPPYGPQMFPPALSANVLPSADAVKSVAHGGFPVMITPHPADPRTIVLRMTGPRST